MTGMYVGIIRRDGDADLRNASTTLSRLAALSFFDSVDVSVRQIMRRSSSLISSMLTRRRSVSLIASAPHLVLRRHHHAAPQLGDTLLGWQLFLGEAGGLSPGVESSRNASENRGCARGPEADVRAGYRMRLAGP